MVRLLRWSGTEAILYLEEELLEILKRRFMFSRVICGAASESNNCRTPKQRQNHRSMHNDEKKQVLKSKELFLLHTLNIYRRSGYFACLNFR